MSKKVTKEGLIVRMELAGYSKTEANKFITSLSGIISEELCKGNEVVLPAVGILRAEIKKQEVKDVMGVSRTIPERLSVKFSASKLLKDHYRAHHSISARQKESIKGLGSKFLAGIK